MKTRLCAFAFLALLRTTSLTFGAEPSVDDLLQGQEIYRAATIKFSLGKFEDAIDLYSKSYELNPRPEILFALGQCEFLLKHYERAYFFYNLFLHNAPPSPKRDKMPQQLAELREILKTLPQAPASAATPPSEAHAIALALKASSAPVESPSPEAPKPTPAVKPKIVEAPKPSPPPPPSAATQPALPDYTTTKNASAPVQHLTFEQRPVGFMVLPKLGFMTALGPELFPLNYGLSLSAEIGFRPKFLRAFSFSIEPMISVTYGNKQPSALAGWDNSSINAWELFLGASILFSYNRTVGPGLFRASIGPNASWSFMQSVLWERLHQNEASSAGASGALTYLFYAKAGAWGVEADYLLTPLKIGPTFSGDSSMRLVHRFFLRAVYLFML